MAPPSDPPNACNVLLIGAGGREHALAAGIARSPRLGALYITGADNPGIARLGTPVDVPVSIREIYRLQRFCETNDVHLVVIGPEDPLAEGYADALATPDRLVFGPGRAGARLEADKAWAKDLMRSASIPTAEARTFTDPERALAYVQAREQPLVVKAAGLAKGKGVIVCDTPAQAAQAIDRVMRRREFGDAGATVVVEERLKGPEISVLALVDGRNILVLPPCQDHKRLGEGDTGPNTGGMGAFCPTPLADERTMQRIERDVLVPTVDALRREGINYRGVLYAGLMLTHAGPKVLEFNVRFGDPETQPLLARLRGDLLTLLWQTAAGRLEDARFDFDPRPACCVVLASEGYPEKPRTGLEIDGLEEAQSLEDVTVFHAGTRRDDRGRLLTAGGRVLNVVALGEDLDAARRRAYEACELIRFPGKTLRRDIAQAMATAGARPVA